MKNKPIAIIGGMGPEASAYLYTTLINNSIKYFHAVNNDDFPEIILYSIPVPDFISTDEKEKEALEILKQKVEKLNALNPLCLAIACNTAHALLSDLQSVSKSPFVSIIDEMVRFVQKDRIAKVGLIGTPSAICSNIYQNALKKTGIITLIPEEKSLIALDKIIRNVIAGSSTKKDTRTLKKIADSLKKRGAEGIILGCTELPLVFPGKYVLPVYNSVEILAMALLQKYYKQNTI